jgi:hypothetical protein
MAERDYMATRLFTDRDSAEREYEAARARVRPERHQRGDDGRGSQAALRARPTTELGNKSLEGAGVGGGIGAVTGGALAAIAAAATVAVPGLGLLVAGPIAAALAGAGAGAVVGGGIGALVGAGIPEERVKEYESGLKEGGILMGVTPKTPQDRTYFDEEWGVD